MRVIHRPHHARELEPELAVVATLVQVLKVELSVFGKTRRAIAAPYCVVVR